MPSMASIAPDILAHRMQKAIDAVVTSKNGIRIFSHHDADGISAAAVLSQALERSNIQFQTRIIKGLTKEFTESLDPSKNYIFMDMGSGQIPELEKKHMVVVLDHHKPDRDSSKVIHVNTHLLGVDGTVEASAASLAFLFAIGLDRRNWDLAPTAVIGMVGDKQHLGGFRGMNALIVKGSLEKGLLESKKGMALEGSSLADALASSFDPYFFGLSGDVSACRTFLEENGFSPEDALSETPEDEKRLASLLALDMLERGVDTDVVQSLSGSRLYDKAREMYVDILVEYSNAAGKAGAGGVGTAMLLGSGWSADVVKEHFCKYRKEVMDRLKMLEKNGAKDHGCFQYVENDLYKLNGAIAGIGMQYMLPQNKPFFAMAETDGKLRVSARGTKKQVMAGLDLSAVCRLCAEKLGGEGGGHPIASGATIPLERKEDFLDEIKKAIEGQMSSDTRP